ncbi:MAG: ferrous iron transport protein B [Planctomycetes bacterium]|nr:ferrous iron transport protein B [Planctomycetota bacterium]
MSTLPPTSAGRVARIALAGNPNTGKTTLFNRLTGLSAKVGNYPGVTVESESGTLRLASAGEVELADVPGTYSLSARSAEEQLAIAAICGLPPLEPPQLVLLVVDATQLTRNLYLALQVIETGTPVVIALNMWDMLAGVGVEIDAAALARELGVPAVPISAQRGQGLDELRLALDRALAEPASARPGPRWVSESPLLRADIASAAAALPRSWRVEDPRRRDALALWALLSLDEKDEISGAPKELRDVVLARRRAAADAGRELDAEIIRGRYAWIDARAPRFLLTRAQVATSRTDKVDRVLLHPVFGFAAFLLAMGLVFQSLFSWADPAIGAIESAIGWFQELVVARLPEGLAADFVGEALIEGVGSVVVFLPQIVLLFLFIGLMEDSGYMARVAFLMDRLMKAIGLHGRAFVPMMSGFACAVPAILATRTMERQRDRMLTMLVVPLMTCSARLPVYSLLIAALFPPSELFGFVPVQGLLMVGMYLFSTLVALAVTAVLGRTLFKGSSMPLLLEMPPYRMPNLRSVAAMVWRKSRVFLTEAGTVIFACTVMMWGLLSFPRDTESEARFDARASELAQAGASDEQLAELENERTAAALRYSLGGRLGRGIEPAIEPLGFDWKIGIGLLGAFAAREVFVSTMGVVYGMGGEVDDETTGLRQRIQQEARADGAPVYTPLVGLALMVFFALACQCMSTIAVVKRETRSWRWPVFLFAYTGALAWLCAFAVYQGGLALGLG